jgi:prophage regulatory protein
MQPQNNLRVLREPERRKKTGVSRTRWWALERKGLAPRRFPIGGSAVGWLEHELDAWIAERASGRDRQQGEA